MYRRLAVTLALIFAARAACMGATPRPKGSASTPAPTPPTYVITNDDANTSFGLNNSISFFLAGGSPSAPMLTYQNTVFVGGGGIDGGYFAAPRLISLPSSNAQCLYVSDAGSGDIASVNLQTQLAAGNFFGSVNDQGTTQGIGLAMNSNYLYASFSDTNTIGTFQVLPGCQLNFVSDVTAAGLNGGGLYALAASGNILIATFGDGSIESFNIAAGTPVPNNDLQNSTGYVNDYNNLPSGIDITADGHYAIFGDGAIQTVVEVSDISSGRLLPTRVYNVGAGPNAVQPRAVIPGNGSTNVRLSPDESLLFISNNQSGNVTAAFFSPSTGVVSPGCTSLRLKNYFTPWYYQGALVTENTSGSGGVLYVAEFGPQSSIGILSITTSGRTCSFGESASSPTTDPTDSGGVLSIWAYPPRPF